MSYVRFQPTAEESLAEAVTDPVLLDAFFAHMGEVAANPATMTEPTVSPPFAPNRLMVNFRLEDADGETWTFVVLVKRLPDEEGLLVTSIRVAGPDYRPPE